MNRRLLVFAILAMLAVLQLFPSEARSATQWGFAAFGGFHTYTMGDVNDAIGTINSLLIAGGSPLRMDEIKGGGSFGAGLRMIPSQKLRLSLDYERLLASSKIADASGSIDLNLPANSIVATATYLFPAQGNTHFGLGGGLGLYMADGSEKDVVVGTGSATYSWDGTGLGFHVLGQGDVTLSKEMHLEVGAGYRYAKVDLSIESQSTNAQLDWSGFMSRVGLAFYPK